MPKRRCVFFWNSFPTIDFECKDENDDNGCVYESVVLQWDRLELCTVNWSLFQWDASVLRHHQPLHLKWPQVDDCYKNPTWGRGLALIGAEMVRSCRQTSEVFTSGRTLDITMRMRAGRWRWRRRRRQQEWGNPAIIIMIASSPVEETARGEEAPALPPSRSGLPSAKRLFFFSILAKRRRRMWLLRWWS